MRLIRFPNVNIAREIARRDALTRRISADAQERVGGPFIRLQQVVVHTVVEPQRFAGGDQELVFVPRERRDRAAAIGERIRAGEVLGLVIGVEFFLGRQLFLGFAFFVVLLCVVFLGVGFWFLGIVLVPGRNEPLRDAAFVAAAEGEAFVGGREKRGQLRRVFVGEVRQ